MIYLYRLYQLCIALPVILILTVITSLTVIVGCFIGNGHFWGYWPGKLWAWAVLKVLLIPVRVSGRENLKRGQSYVFVSNHQGAFDIFIIYGHLCRNFKWMMKYQLRKIPFVGAACEAAHFIFVDKRGPSKIKKTYENARHTLRDGMSVVVFPEGARTFTGHMGVFKRGAFMLADELQLPVVPLTINGSFNVMPRTNKWYHIDRHPLSLTIHAPIYPTAHGADDITAMMNKSYEVIMADLVPEYQGYRENPDQ